MSHTDFHDLAHNFRKDQTWHKTGKQFDESLTALEWAPTGTTCAIGQLDGHIRISHISRTIDECCSLKPSTSRITSVSFNETSDLFASTALDEKSINVFGFNSGTGQLDTKNAIRVNGTEVPRFAAFMEDVARGQNILISGIGNGLKLYDVDSGTLFRDLMIRGGTTSLRSWQGCMMAVGVGDKSVQIWDVRVKEAVWVYRPAGTSVRPCFDIDHCNRILTVADDKGGVIAADLACRKEIAKKSPNMRFLTSADEESLVMSNFNDPANISTHELDKTLKITGIRWHPEECSFLSRSTDKQLILWNYLEEKK
ncbi:unnamed protein product, partial [Mesorhabditis spiculigera]